MRNAVTWMWVGLVGCGDEAATRDVPDAATSAETDAQGDTSVPGDCVSPGGAGPRFDRSPHRFRAGVYATHRALTGAVWDGSPPEPLVEAERQGQCRLLRYTPSLCEPQCDFGQPCIEGACVAWPAPISAGTLTLTGIAPAPVTVAPSEGTYWWQAEGAYAVESIGLVAEGDVVPAFSLATCVPAPLSQQGDWSALLEDRAQGDDVTLTWDASAGARIYLRMTTGIGTHGGISPVEIECEGPDQGTLTLPGAYLDALYADGWSCGECGGNDLVRYFAAEADAGGTTVELSVETARSFWYRP